MIAARIERKEITEAIPYFTVPFNENGNFDPSALDKFAEGFKKEGDKPTRLRLHWVATQTRIFFFPEKISHTKFYRCLEKLGEETELRAAGVYDICPTPRGVDRHLYGGPPEALAWLLTPSQSERFRMGTIREIFGGKFIYYKS